MDGNLQGLKTHWRHLSRFEHAFIRVAGIPNPSTIVAADDGAINQDPVDEHRTSIDASSDRPILLNSQPNVG